MPQPQLQSHPDAATPEPVCGLALLDAENRFEWVNEQLAHMLGLEADALTGQTPADLPEETRAWFTNEHDQLRWSDPLGQARWLTLERHAAGDKSLLVLRDVSTEQELRNEIQRLQQQIQDLKLTDDLTGLPNRRAISQALELQISRSRRYKNPLSIILVHIGLDDEQVELLRDGADPLVLSVSRFLRDRLRWVDQIGRWEENIFLLVLPETEQKDAQGLVTKITAELSDMELPPPLENIKPILSFGVGVWQKGDDLRTLLRSASQDLAGE